MSNYSAAKSCVLSLALVLPSIGLAGEDASVPQAVIQAQLSKYYDLKATDKAAAKQLLQIILKEEPSNMIAKGEMGYLLLSEKNYQEALAYFMALAKDQPQNKDYPKQIQFIEDILNKKPAPAVVVVKKERKPVLPKLSPEQILLNDFYQAKKENPEKAEAIAKEAIAKFPDNIQFYKELGYLLITEKKYEQALTYFKIIEQKEPHNYEIKMQVAYLLAQMHYNRQAYNKFEEVLPTQDAELKLTANKAMTNLAGLNTTVFPEPWFADIYYSPLYYSRFNDLFVFPMQSRLGVKLGEQKQLDLYANVRGTYDSKSQVNLAAQVSQIFEDDAIIMGFGSRFRPLAKTVPYLTLYVEAGRAYNLILKPGQTQWQNDLRGGLFFSGNWGMKPEYSDKLRFPFEQVGALYGDATYYSRYAGNIIAYMSLKQGFRVAEYHAAFLDLYLRARGAVDKQEQFFNNFTEIGPGIQFYPNNRYGISLRIEFIKGFYIPVSSPSPNPYGSNYYNTFGLLEYYMVF